MTSETCTRTGLGCIWGRSTCRLGKVSAAEPVGTVHPAPHAPFKCLDWVVHILCRGSFWNNLLNVSLFGLILSPRLPAPNHGLNSGPRHFASVSLWVTPPAALLNAGLMCALSDQLRGSWGANGSSSGPRAVPSLRPHQHHLLPSPLHPQVPAPGLPRSSRSSASFISLPRLSLQAGAARRACPGPWCTLKLRHPARPRSMVRAVSHVCLLVKSTCFSYVLQMHEKTEKESKKTSLTLNIYKAPGMHLFA